MLASSGNNEQTRHLMLIRNDIAGWRRTQRYWEN